MKILKKILFFLLDLLFPLECVGCQEEGSWLCKKCEASVLQYTADDCVLCGEKAERFHVCTLCRKKYGTAGVCILFSYQDKKVQKLIHTYKYIYAFDIADTLTSLITSHVRGSPSSYPPLFEKNMVFVPVPLHKKRLKERGFNQSALLAQKISSSFGKEYTPVLRRKSYRSSQISLSRSKRRENVREVFTLSGSVNLSGKRVVPVDDIVTTGATLQACAEAIKIGQPAEIWGLVIAKNILENGLTKQTKIATVQRNEK